MKEDNPTYKPASSIAPSIVPRTVYSIEDTEQFWKEANTELHRCFQKGSMIGKGNSVVDTDYIKVIDDWFDKSPLIDTNINSEETYDNIQQEKSISKSVRKTSGVRLLDEVV